MDFSLVVAYVSENCGLPLYPGTLTRVICDVCGPPPPLFLRDFTPSDAWVLCVTNPGIFTVMAVAALAVGVLFMFVNAAPVLLVVMIAVFVSVQAIVDRIRARDDHTQPLRAEPLPVVIEMATRSYSGFH